MEWLDEHGNASRIFVVEPDEFKHIVSSRQGCANGVVVPEPEIHPGAIKDCEVLLAARDFLVGSGEPLDWDLATPLAKWDGVASFELLAFRFDGTRYSTGRVGHLDLSDRGLAGTVPSGFGNLEYLQFLQLEGNNMTGCVPLSLKDVQGFFGGIPFCVDPPTVPVPISPDACTDGVSVAEPDINTELVQDCLALLSLQSALAGSATLNWSPDLPVDEWAGVRVEGSPMRVTWLELTREGLTGVIPPQIGKLAGITNLFLGGNRLTGPIPSELSNLASLQYLELSDNQLSGEFPLELGGLKNLQFMYIHRNQVNGCVPVALEGVDGHFGGLPFCNAIPDR